jgi:hypothetical protein
MIEAFAPDAPDEPFAHRIHQRRTHRRSKNANASAFGSLIEDWAELVVAIADKELRPLSEGSSFPARTSSEDSCSTRVPEGHARHALSRTRFVERSIPFSWARPLYVAVKRFPLACCPKGCRRRSLLAAHRLTRSLTGQPGNVATPPARGRSARQRRQLRDRRDPHW